MRRKFRISGSVVVGSQEFDDEYGFFSLNSNEVECTDTSLLSVPIEHLVVLDGVVQKKTDDDIAALNKEPYNDAGAKEALLVQFGLGWLSSHSTLYMVLSDCLTCKNWTRLQSISDQALGSGIVSQAEYDVFFAILRQYNAPI